MLTVIIELFLYFIMAGMIKKLTDLSGLVITIVFGVIFSVITMLPLVWLTLPLLLAALIFLTGIRRNTHIYLLLALTIIPAIGLSWALYADQNSTIMNVTDVPADFTNIIKERYGNDFE